MPGPPGALQVRSAEREFVCTSRVIIARHFSLLLMDRQLTYDLHSVICACIFVLLIRFFKQNF